MTVIEEALQAHLTGDTDVAALVGTRVYPLRAEQGAARPYLVYQRISTPRVRSHSGPSGLASPRFQITAVADSYSEVKDLANAVRVALDGYSGDMGDAPGIRANAFIDNDADGWEEASQTYTVRVDVIVWHAE